MSARFENLLPLLNKQRTAKRCELKKFYYQLRSLDSENYGSWPKAVKLFMLMAVILITCVISYALPINSQLKQIKAQQNQQQTLLETYRSTKAQVQQQPNDLTQQKIDQQRLSQLAQLLPTKESIALPQQFNELALSSGVVLQDLVVDAEIKQTFYIEQPLHLVALGNYHQLGQFLGSLSALPRLVTVHDFNLKPVPQVAIAETSTPHLVLTLHIKAYRAKQEDPTDTQAKTQIETASSNTNTELKE
ncbi:type 4a pilus biogenesis protein PilO [Psychrobacter sanguinis]|uniref:type 4a pilus biogenesis protein PilO n=1 Tax=Psychrobacter sanguinis TaxID=861445 RepID=UPI0028A78F62|nr:type 4a pilus biogenesis protein PilO [Psychrobacter sanguinis]